MDGIDRLVRNARSLIEEGYYDGREAVPRSPSFMDLLWAAEAPSRVIAEIKFASPSMTSGKTPGTFGRVLDAIAGAKPLGLSVLAEPRIFGGDLDHVRRAARKGLPVLMKDIIVDPVQIDAAAASGASAVLLIQAVESKGLLARPMQALVDTAHDRDLDVVLEVHTAAEWDAATATDADILGINNRDLSTMDVDLRTTPNLLASRPKDRPVIAMSGVERRDQVEALLAAGADAVLVGTSIMSARDPARKLEELLHG